MGKTGRLVVAVTGASGAIYGLRLLRHSASLCKEVYALVSAPACDVIRHEIGTEVDPESLSAQALYGEPLPNVRFLQLRDYFAPVASGSFRHDGMIVAPCSMGSAGRIASGASDDLITRAADVTLKERRPLVLVVREAPLSLIHLRNLTALAEAGATVLPAAPSFYSHPDSVEELVDTVVRRALQCVGLAPADAKEWGIG